MIPGEYFIRNEYIILNKNRRVISVRVANTGDRPIQVGSHYHFFEVNKYLSFIRKEAFGMRLDIPSGTAIRFEPGEEKEISLVSIAGDKTVFGFNGLTEGCVDDQTVKGNALIKAKKLGFKGVD